MTLTRPVSPTSNLAVAASITPQVSVVCGTVGRPIKFLRLVESILHEASSIGVEFLVIDSDPTRAAHQVLLDHAAGLAWTYWHAPEVTGISDKRNLGLDHARGAIVAFIDDDGWYPPGALETLVRVYDETPEAIATCGMVRSGDGRLNPMRWARTSRRIRARNVHRTVAGPAIAVRRERVQGIRFDPALGPGAPGVYAGAEDHDFVHQLCRRGLVAYRTDLTVGHDQPSDSDPAAAGARMLAYGRGFGFVARRWGLSRTIFAALLARRTLKVALLRLRGRSADAKVAQAFLSGMVRGYAQHRPPLIPAAPTPRGPLSAIDGS